MGVSLGRLERDEVGWSALSSFSMRLISLRSLCVSGWSSAIMSSSCRVEGEKTVPLSADELLPVVSWEDEGGVGAVRFVVLDRFEDGPGCGVGGMISSSLLLLAVSLIGGSVACGAALSAGDGLVVVVLVAVGRRNVVLLAGFIRLSENSTGPRGSFILAVRLPVRNILSSAGLRGR